MVAHQEDVVSRMTRVPTHQEFSRSCLFCVEGNALRPEDPKAGWGAMKALSKSGLLLTFCLELFSMVLFSPTIHPTTRSSLLALLLWPPTTPNSTLSLSVPVRKQRGNYVPASTFLSSHSVFP